VPVTTPIPTPVPTPALAPVTALVTAPILAPVTVSNPSPSASSSFAACAVADEDDDKYNKDAAEEKKIYDDRCNAMRDQAIKRSMDASAMPTTVTPSAPPLAPSVQAAIDAMRSSFAKPPPQCVPDDSDIVAVTVARLTGGPRPHGEERPICKRAECGMDEALDPTTGKMVMVQRLKPAGLKRTWTPKVKSLPPALPPACVQPPAPTPAAVACGEDDMEMVGVLDRNLDLTWGLQPRPRPAAPSANAFSQAISKAAEKERVARIDSPWIFEKTEGTLVGGEKYVATMKYKEPATDKQSANAHLHTLKTHANYTIVVDRDNRYVAGWSAPPESRGKWAEAILL
jgi:hypothetical protein